MSVDWVVTVHRGDSELDAEVDGSAVDAQDAVVVSVVFVKELDVEVVEGLVGEGAAELAEPVAVTVTVGGGDADLSTLNRR